MKLKAHVIRMGDKYEARYASLGYSPDSIIELRVITNRSIKHEYCCDAAKQHKDSFSLTKRSPFIYPVVTMWTGHGYHDDDPSEVQVNFCPFCGAKIEVQIVEESKYVKRIRGKKVPVKFETLREESIEIERVKVATTSRQDEATVIPEGGM